MKGLELASRAAGREITQLTGRRVGVAGGGEASGKTRLPAARLKQTHMSMFI